MNNGDINVSETIPGPSMPAFEFTDELMVGLKFHLP